MLKIVRKTLSEIKIEAEMQVLRNKYEEAIKHKLKMRNFMSTILKHWANILYSKAWR